MAQAIDICQVTEFLRMGKIVQPSPIGNTRNGLKAHRNHDRLTHAHARAEERKERENAYNSGISVAWGTVHPELLKLKLVLKKRRDTSDGPSVLARAGFT